METVWIIGAGKFGLRAAKLLAKQGGAYKITIVDQDRESLKQAGELGCRTETADAVDFLVDHLPPGEGTDRLASDQLNSDRINSDRIRSERVTSDRKLPDWIVPAVPVHLAWEWCLRSLGPDRIAPEDLPGEMEALLPNPMRGAGPDLYVSHADFLCPPNCNEPDDKCTKTGEPRKEDMFRLLAGIAFSGITPFVIQSIQLGPGVGGYRPRTLMDVRDRISRHRGDFFLATACRCHGVLSGGCIRGILHTAERQL